MTKDELVTKLVAIRSKPLDPAVAHIVADQCILEYIDDPGVWAAFEDIEKWYVYGQTGT